ncbi:MAG: tRNA dihydrouridine synthase DusB [Bacteroidota bacterium]|nr:tRNA dihydrouridine synthase DusB [Bacteroidota bacterium]
MNIGSIQLPEFPLMLAPMEDVSDPPFRAICKQQGADLLYTEFISSQGLLRNATKYRKKLDIFNDERPVGIQIFGGDEESLAMAAVIVETTAPDLVDINFGCPVKGIVCKGAGAGVLKDIDLMVRLTKAVVNATALPVTVKTRLGWDASTINIEDVAERLQDVGIKAITIHGRTRCQLYKGQADWQLIGKVKNNPRICIPVFGNGDIDSPQKAAEYKSRYGVDGIMIGRAAIGYPWIFREIKHYLNTGEQLSPPTVAERIEVCKQHLLSATEWEVSNKGIFEMRGRYSNYLKGLPGIRNFIKRLVVLDNVEELLEMLDEINRRYVGFEIAYEPVELRNYHEHCRL